MKKVLFIMMLSMMFGQTTKSVSYEESIKIEIIARKHAKEDIKIFITKKYYLPERRIVILIKIIIKNYMIYMKIHI